MNAEAKNTYAAQPLIERAPELTQIKLYKHSARARALMSGRH